MFSVLSLAFRLGTGRLSDLGASFAEASEGILLRGLAQGKSCEAPWAAKQDGGGRRTRTFEVIRRLIYSQLPLPLGTLPRSNPIANPPAEMATEEAMDDVKTKDPITGSRLGAFMAESPRQSQPIRPANKRPHGAQIAIIRNP